jgi:hypothetical protein
MNTRSMHMISLDLCKLHMKLDEQDDDYSDEESSYVTARISNSSCK